MLLVGLQESGEKIGLGGRTGGQLEVLRRRPKFGLFRAEGEPFAVLGQTEVQSSQVAQENHESAVSSVVDRPSGLGVEYLPLSVECVSR